MQWGVIAAGVVGFSAHLMQTSDTTPTLAYFSEDVVLFLAILTGLARVPAPTEGAPRHARATRRRDNGDCRVRVGLLMCSFR